VQPSCSHTFRVVFFSQEFINCVIHSFIHSFILHSVNPYKVLNNRDIERVILLIIFIYNKYYNRVHLNIKPIKYKV